jgi:tetratricopeptide (TPR) repeat protein
MSRDSIVYSICSFLLGLILGSLLIGPKLAKPSGAPAPPPASGAAEGGGAPPSGPMNMVRQQLASLKEAVARDPRNFDALVQLGNMYMDAAKYPQAIDYYERALAVRNDGLVRTDLGICYKQNGQLDKALAAFQKASADSPGQWQPLFNAAAVLGEMHRFDEARAVVSKLKAMRPNDPEVQRLEAALK